MPLTKDGKHWDPRCELDKASDLVQKLQRRQPVSFAEERVTKIYKHDYTVTTEEGLDATRAVVIFTDFGTRMVMVEKMGAYNPNTHETKFELKCNLDGDDIMLHAVINTYNAELTGEGWAILIRDREDIWDEKKWKREQEEKEKADLVTDSDVEAKE